MNTNQAQIIHDLSNEAYHQRSEISKSGLDLIYRAPAIYQHRQKNPQEQTAAMRWGTLVHTAILEPETFEDRIVVAPKIDRRTTQGKADWAAFEIAARGKDLITTDEAEALRATREAAWAHPATGKALGMIREVETSIIWDEEETGIACRCRPDAILSNGLILDVKTTVDASADSFAKSIANYRYHVQAAFYSDGYQAAFREQPKGFVFLAIEKEPPYLCALYVMDAKAVIRGRADYQRDLRTLAECRSADTWPGLAEQPVVIDLPKWA